ALIGEWIENDSQRTPLVVAARDVAIQTITDGSDQENGDCSKTHPFERRATLDALTVVNGHRDKSRNHQNPDDSDLVRRGHRRNLAHAAPLRSNKSDRSCRRISKVMLRLRLPLTPGF